MLMLSEAVLDEVKKIIREDLPNEVVWCFGSRVKGTAKAFSDLDLVVMPSEHLTEEALIQTREALMVSEIPIRVDLVLWDKLPESIKAEIQECHIVLQTTQSNCNLK